MQKKQPRCEDGIEYWECSKCHMWLPNTEYYTDTRTGNGLKGQCKKCHTKGSIETRSPDNTRRLNREYMRRARVLSPDRFRERERIASTLREKNEKTKARMILNVALRAGKVVKPKNCQNCGKALKLTAHHSDYSKPLEVKWWCYECHSDK